MNDGHRGGAGFAEERGAAAAGRARRPCAWAAVAPVRETDVRFYQARTPAAATKTGGGQRRGKNPAAVPRTCTSTVHRRRLPRRPARAGQIWPPGHRTGGPRLHHHLRDRGGGEERRRRTG